MEGGDGNFLATSTPVRWNKDATAASPWDSGYFGSASSKGSSSSLFSERESSAGRVPFLNLPEEALNDIRMPPWLRKDYPKPSPEPSFDSPIIQERPGRQAEKRKHVDFLSELGRKNCPRLVSLVLRRLSAEDLRRASCVGRGWRDAVRGDIEAERRRKRSVLEARRRRILALAEKENKLGQQQVDEREHKTAFCDISNQPTNEKQPLRPQTDDRFRSFLQGAETLAKGEVLGKCPRCRFASRILNGSYVCFGCNYTFCADCGGPACTPHKCGRGELPSIMIGSKRSRRNLKRL